ncbi:MAG: DUF58 domain-containing protein [Myxococcales bacterium]|nr:DUF58 domain-containing protein [Myxococcales bacterium]
MLARLASLLDRWRDVDFARLNHILIPSKSRDRERFRRGRAGRLAALAFGFYEAFTREGHALIAVSVGAFFAGFDVEHSDALMLWCALAGALTASFVSRRALRFSALRVEVSHAPRVSAAAPLGLVVTLYNDSDRDVFSVRVEGPFLPWDGRYLTQAQTVARVPRNGAVRVFVEATFRALGEHQLDPFRAAALGTFGLTQGPGAYSNVARFVVVPPITPVTLGADALSGRGDEQALRSALRGDASMDLRGLRPYRPGDRVRDLHARSWARTGVAMVREYDEPQTRRALVIVNRQGRGRDRHRFEKCLSLAAGVVAALEQRGLHLVALLLGETLHPFAESASAAPPQHLDEALDLLASLEVHPTFESPRFEASLDRVFDPSLAVHVVTLDGSPALQPLIEALTTRGARPTVHGLP